MNRRHYEIVVLFSISLLAAALVPLSGQEGSGYNPWLDHNDDGIIDVEDLYDLGKVYGASGTPLNMPMSLAYDSGWINITDKRGQYFDITPGFNLETSTWAPSIYGRTVAGGEIHQKYCYGFCQPGWNQTYGGTDSNLGEIRTRVVQTSDGGYAIAGYTNSFASGWQAYSVKTEKRGMTSLGTHLSPGP